VTLGRLAVLDALREPHFLKLWVAGACAHTARWMDVLVLGWVALELTDSPLLVGLAGFCRSIPMIAVGPVAGLIADRLDRSRVMLAAQVVNTAVAGVLALLFATGNGAFPPLVLLSLVLGVMVSVDFPSRRTALYALVGPARVTNAISLESVAVQGSKILGPVLGGVLLARFGATGCYLAMVGLYGVAVLLQVALARRVPMPGAGGGEPMAGGLAAAVREVWANPLIRAVLVITVLMNSLVFPHQNILAVFARDVLAIGPARLGLVVAANGVGALAGALIIAARRGPGYHGPVFGLGSLAAAVLLVAFALLPWYGPAVVLQLLIGFAEAGFGTMQSAIVLLAAPERLRGRAMGILSGCIGTYPLGALWIGFLAGEIGAAPAIALGAGVAALAMLPVVARLVSRSLPAIHSPR
jgi:MFS family permease